MRSLVSLGSFLLAGLLFVHPNLAGAQAQAKAGEITSLSGGVKVLRSDGITRDEGRAGMPIYAGDRIETDPAGVAKIKMQDNSVLTVGRLTTTRITEYAFDFAAKKRKALVQLVIGQIHLAVERYADWQASQYEVRTGAAVAGIRGTTLVARVMTNGLSEFYVVDGIVEVRGAQSMRGFTPVRERQFTQVPLGAEPAAPLLYDPGRLKAIYDNLGEAMPRDLFKASKTTALNTASEQEAQKNLSQADWAKMLAESLGLAAAGIQEGLDSGDYVDYLTGGEGRLMEAESPSNQSKYLAKVDAPLEKASGGAYLEARGLSGTVRMSAFVPRAGKYPVKLKACCGNVLLSVGNQTTVLEDDGSKELTWKQAGQVQFQGGENAVNVVLSRGAAVDAFQIDARCADPIAPAAGWDSGGNLTYAEKAETMVKAMGQLGNLPLDNSYVQVLRGENVGSARGEMSRVAVQPAGSAPGAQPRNAVKAGVKAATLSWNLNLPSDGVYSFAVQAAGTAAFQWSLDGCEIAKHIPQYPELTSIWEDVISRNITKGNHILEVAVPAGGTFDSVRIVRRKSTAADYLALLKGLGFSEGDADQPVTQASAQDNLNNEFFRAFLGDEVASADEVLTPNDDTETDPDDDTPPDFTDDDDFDLGSPASPVIPGIF